MMARASRKKLLEMYKTFIGARKAWRKATLNDREYGRKKIEQSLALAVRARDVLVPKKRAKAFNEMLQVTGVGDHPEMIRLMYRAGKYLEEGMMVRQVPQVRRRKRKKRK